MRIFKTILFLFISLILCFQNLIAQNNYSKKTISISNIDSTKFEGSLYLSQELNSNWSLGSHVGVIFNLGVKVSNEVLLGITTQDTRVNGGLRHIHHYFAKYNFDEDEDKKHKSYFSLKIPTKSFTKIKNDQFKFLRLGLGHKIKFHEQKKYDFFIDLNYDFMISSDNNSIYDSTFLFGITITNRYRVDF